MNNQSVAFAGKGSMSATVLILALLSLSGCAPICDTVNWWSACYSNIHGDDPSAVPSEIAALPSPDYASAVEFARLLVRAHLVEQNIPGLSVAVGAGGDVVWAEGFGFADILSRRPVTPATLFRIGSVAMPMTATAVGILIERGELDIDRPARFYIPSFPETTWPFTTRQLMGHVAGIGHRITDDEEMLYRRDSCRSALDAVAIVADDPQRFAPETGFEFSIYGWTLVGAVVETVAGRPFFDLMQQEVFDAAGMTRTVLDNRAEATDGTTSFYWPFTGRDTTTGIENSNNPDNTCLQGAAGLLSTPTDVVNFGGAVFDGRLITAETLAMLQTPVVLASGESTGQGLGWTVREIEVGPNANPTTAYGQSAISAGGTTSFVVLPEHGIVVALAANVSYVRNLRSLSDQVAAAFVSSR